ncbi:hypothetical protein IWQ61_000798 [Dispira simplex]|nr:hypothetical protein IWQ61_000798 [Dispira simplex]
MEVQPPPIGQDRERIPLLHLSEVASGIREGPVVGAFFDGPSQADPILRKEIPAGQSARSTKRNYEDEQDSRKTSCQVDHKIDKSPRGFPLYSDFTSPVDKLMDVVSGMENPWETYMNKYVTQISQVFRNSRDIQSYWNLVDRIQVYSRTKKALLDQMVGHYRSMVYNVY